MIPRRLRLCWVLAGAAAGAALLRADSNPPEPATPAVLPARAHNWVLRTFTREGYLSMVLRGTEVSPNGPDRIDIVDMNLAVFSRSAPPAVDSILLSPSASFYPRENVATGTGSVRLIRSDIEVTGEQWRYDDADKKVSIAKNVRVLYHAPLISLLQ